MALSRPGPYVNVGVKSILLFPSDCNALTVVVALTRFALIILIPLTLERKK